MGSEMCIRDSPHAAAAWHVQLAPEDAQPAVDAGKTGSGREQKSCGGTAKQGAGAPPTDACTAGRRPSSVHSRHSSHDAIDSVPDAEQGGQGGWWKRRNRCAFLGEDIERMVAVERALDAVASVHETDSLMYHEMMLPAWELTPVRHSIP